MMPITNNSGTRGVSSVQPQTSSSSGAAPATTAPDLLPPADASSGDPIADVAKLLATIAKSRGQQEALTADAEDKAEDAADARRIASMEKKADMNFASGLANGVGQIAQGVCSIGAAVAGGKAIDPSRAGGADKTLADVKMKGWDGAGSISGGSGKITEAVFKKSADGADVDVARAESDSKMHKRASEALRKQVDANSQSEQKVIQILQDIKQTQAQSEHAALLKM